jgi:hypothetical protein
VRRVGATLLLVALVACGREAPKLAPVRNPPSTQAATLQTTPTTTAQTTTTLIPADEKAPAAGSCGNAPSGGAAVITLNPDVPSPRCMIVHSLNQLTFVNNTDTQQTVDTGYDSATLAPHASHAFVENVGDHWAPGVHRVQTSLYAGSGPEVWLQN